MLTVGLVHGELASLLWGGAFGFVWCYAVVVRTLVARQQRVRRPQGRLELPDGTLWLRSSPPPTPAFFRWTVVTRATHSPTRSVTHRLTLEGPDTPIPLGLPRGRYEIVVTWELADVFGLTRLVPRHQWTTTLLVEPTSLPFSPPPPPATKSGPWRPRRAGRRAGDPFDVRRYAPGDDLRRLHWPLYAHAGIPFVRTAEPTPPPTGHQFLILDTEAPTEEVLDDRLGRLATWLRILDSQGTPWTLAIPSVGESLTSEPGPTLAALTPATLPSAPVNPHWPETVTLLTGPESQGAAQLARKLAATRRRYRPVVVVPPSPVSLPEPWWRRRS